jgi:hypothetical protein
MAGAFGAEGNNVAVKGLQPSLTEAVKSGV